MKIPFENVCISQMGHDVSPTSLMAKDNTPVNMKLKPTLDQKILIQNNESGTEILSPGSKDQTVYSLEQ